MATTIKRNKIAVGAPHIRREGAGGQTRVVRLEVRQVASLPQVTMAFTDTTVLKGDGDTCILCGDCGYMFADHISDWLVLNFFPPKSVICCGKCGKHNDIGAYRQHLYESSTSEAGRHIRTLDETLSELHPVSDLTREPASMHYQYLGTIVDNTLVLLVGVANSLDQGSRSISFSNFENWISTLAAVHRSFYASILIAVEKSLTELCASENITLDTRRDQAAALIKELDGVLNSRQKSKIKYLAGGNHLGFFDYLDAVLAHKIADDGVRQTWRNFFDALSVVRNKSSHSDTSLTDSDLKKLREGGCEALISDKGELQINCRNYRQVVHWVMEFYQVIEIPLPSST